MVQHHTALYSPQQNDVVERRNQTVVGMARSMMKAKKMSTEFWGEAVTTGRADQGPEGQDTVRGLAWTQAECVLPQDIWLCWPCQEHKGPPQQAGGQKHAHGDVGL